MAKLRYLHVGLAAILISVGLKMLLRNFFETPVLFSLAIICAILLGTILTSLRAARPHCKLAENSSGSGAPPATDPLETGPLRHGSYISRKRAPATTA